jgi:hypothetical protein
MAVAMASTSASRASGLTRLEQADVTDMRGLLRMSEVGGVPPPGPDEPAEVMCMSFGKFRSGAKSAVRVQGRQRGSRCSRFRTLVAVTDEL